MAEQATRLLRISPEALDQIAAELGAEVIRWHEGPDGIWSVTLHRAMDPAVARWRIDAQRWRQAADELDAAVVAWEVSSHSSGLGMPHRMTYAECARQLRELLQRLGLTR